MEQAVWLVQQASRRGYADLGELFARAPPLYTPSRGVAAESPVPQAA